MNSPVLNETEILIGSINRSPIAATNEAISRNLNLSPVRVFEVVSLLARFRSYLVKL